MSISRWHDVTDEELYVHALARALLLAAIERAADDPKHGAVDREHNEYYDGPIGTADVEHIGAHSGAWAQWAHDDERWWIESQGGPADRDIRRGLKAAEADGLAYVVRIAGRPQRWGLTPDGDVWLREFEAEHGAVELPEAPRHRRWRRAQEEAREKLESARQSVRDAASELARLAECDDLLGKAFFDNHLRELARVLAAIADPEPDA
jgi:hypothetical protein